MTPTDSDRLFRQNGPAIKALRNRLDLTQRELAEKLPGHRHPKTIANIEREAKQAGKVLLAQIAAALGVDIAEISRKLRTAIHGTHDHDAVSGGLPAS